MSQRGIAKIYLRYGNCVDYLEIHHHDNHLASGGKTTGGSLEKTIVLASDEYVRQIKGRYGDGLDNVVFVTNKATYGPYGGNGGNTNFDYHSEDFKRIRVKSLDSYNGIFMHICGKIHQNDLEYVS